MRLNWKGYSIDNNLYLILLLQITVDHLFKMILYRYFKYVISNCICMLFFSYFNTLNFFQIPVPCIHVEKCFDSVDLGKGGMILKSGLNLPKLSFVEEVKISEMGRELTIEETSDIIRYALACEKLKRLS